MTAKKGIEREIDAELEEEGREEARPAYRPGEIARGIRPALEELVRMYCAEDARDQVLGFLGWVPPEALERFLCLALEYATDRTSPTKRGRSRRG
jgi:hypothetical protein